MWPENASSPCTSLIIPGAEPVHQACIVSYCGLMNAGRLWTRALQRTATPAVAAAWLVIMLLLTLAIPPQTLAADSFIRHRSLDPLTATIGLPVSAARPAPGESQWQLAFEHGSIFTGGRSSGEQLLLDGETSRLALRYARAASACLSVELAAEAIAHGGGVFDTAIDDWHQLFGLPDGSRDEAPINALSYRYQNDSGDGFSVRDPVQGLGDLSLAVAQSWRCAGHSSPLLRVGLKLPSGQRRSLLGSGSTDTFADIQLPLQPLGKRGWYSASAGLLIPGRVDGFPAQRRLVAYASTVAGWRLTHRWQAVAQIDARTPVFDSPLTELGSASMVLTTGVRAGFGRRHRFELSIAEDLIVDTAQDIVLRLAWTYSTQ